MPRKRRSPVRWIVHLGPPKTGSSSIQLLLRANASRLFDVGICVPTSGWRVDSHQGVAYALRDGHPAVLDELRDEVARSGCHTVVVSTEDLFPILTAGPERLARSGLLEPGDQVEVVGLTRPLAPWLVSLWGESLRTSQGMWIDVALRQFYIDRWTRLLPVLRPVVTRGRALRPDVEWVGRAIAPRDGDARSLLRLLDDELADSMLADPLPNVNASDSAWIGLCRWVGRAAQSTPRRAPPPAQQPVTAAGRRLSEEGLGVFLTADDRTWLEEHTERWLRTEVGALVAAGYLDPDEATALAERSRRPLPAPLDDGELLALIAEASEDVRASEVPHVEASARPSLRVAHLSWAQVLPYDRLDLPRRVRGGPVLTGFRERTFERQHAGGAAIDEALPPWGVDVPRMEGEYVWMGPVLADSNDQIAHFAHRLLPALQEAPEAAVLVTTSEGWPDATAALPDRLREVLAHLGVAPERVAVLGQPLSVERLVIAEQGQQPRVPPHPEYLEMLAPLSRAPAGWDVPLLYVSRGGREPGFAGELYLEDAVERCGGLVLRPEEHSLREQLELYASADTLLCAESSDLEVLGLLGPVLGSTLLLRRGGSAAHWRALLAPRARSFSVINAVAAVMPEHVALPGLSVLDPEALRAALLMAGVDVRETLDPQEYRESASMDLLEWAAHLDASPEPGEAAKAPIVRAAADGLQAER